MKLSKDEQLFLKELLIGEESLKDRVDAILEPSNQVLSQLSGHAQLLLVAKTQHREVYFPLIDPNEIEQLTMLHYAFPHVVDVRGIHRYWRITPEPDTYLESPSGRWPICSLSLSGAQLIQANNSDKPTLKSLMTDRLSIKTAQGERIPVTVNSATQRDFNTLVVVFDELTTQSPALKEFLCKCIFFSSFIEPT